ncbi:unnamed protein product [Dovyalis caffra]|uniref:Large ribosomal subunit protein uL6 alpha-beta domain-containing protein n=1 Tax=Dovyalis caffra TaxID=77055 RepID=A0AAV1RU44_9ROSI|nr:unnamed protein product [Dovyalis caffra]
MARRQILNEMGYEFTIVTADIDEKSIRKDKPEELVMALAEAKANTIIEKLLIEGHVEEDATATLLITADTVVVSDGMVREKPNSKEEAREFIKGYSGGHAAVIGSVVVSNLTTGIRKGAWEKAEVYFHEIPDQIIDSVIEEGSTLHVAGGLTLEHPLTSPFVQAVLVDSYISPDRLDENRAAATDLFPSEATLSPSSHFYLQFFRFLKIVGVGYKARAEAEGRLLYLKLGYSHEVELTVPPAVRVFCFKNNVVCCTGIDKGRVHQFAAAVRSCKPPEVYKGKGIMYIDEVIKKKQGKKSK